MATAAPTFQAGGTIYPSTFVILDSGLNNTVLGATSTSVPLIGIAQEWQKYAPAPGNTNEAADAGDNIMVYTNTSVCQLQSTTAGWNAGAFLTTNASGYGLTTAPGSGLQYGAVALTDVTGAALGKVQVQLGKA